MDAKAAELVALLERQDEHAAWMLLQGEGLSASAVLSLLERAVVAEKKVAHMMQAASRAVLRSNETCDLNTAILKDGKTLLHLAAAKHNLVMMRMLVDAGAKMTVADRKGVRVVDVVTWTDVIYPVIACPLQNSIFKLEQRNEALADGTTKLTEAAAKTAYAADMLGLEENEARDHLDAAMRFRAGVDTDIDHIRHRICETEHSISTQGPRMELMEEEIIKTREMIATMLQTLDEASRKATKLCRERESLRANHAELSKQLDIAEKKCSVKCETVEIMRRFAPNVEVQIRFVQSLNVMLQSLEATRKLVMGGIQSWLLDIICRHGNNPTLFRCSVTATQQLISIQTHHLSDDMLSKYLKPWPAAIMVHELTRSALQLLDTIDSGVDPVSVYSSLLSFLLSIIHSPSAYDVDAAGALDLIRASMQKLVQHTSFDAVGMHPNLQTAITTLSQM